MKKMFLISILFLACVNISAQRNNFVYEVTYNNSNHNNLSDNLGIDIKTRLSCYFGYRVGRNLIFGYGQHYFYVDDQAIEDHFTSLIPEHYYISAYSQYSSSYSSLYFPYSCSNYNWIPSFYIKLLLPISKHLEIGLHFEYQFGRIYHDSDIQSRLYPDEDLLNKYDRISCNYRNFNISPELRINLCSFWGFVINMNGYNKMKYPSSFRLGQTSERGPERETYYTTKRSFNIDKSSWSFGTYFYF